MLSLFDFATTPRTFMLPAAVLMFCRLRYAYHAYADMLMTHARYAAADAARYFYRLCVAIF